MKKIVCLALALCLMLFTAGAMAAMPFKIDGVNPDGASGDGWSWNETKQELTISKSGLKVSDWVNQNASIMLDSGVDDSVTLTVESVAIKEIDFDSALAADKTLTVNAKDSVFLGGNGIKVNNEFGSVTVNATNCAFDEKPTYGIYAWSYYGSVTVNATNCVFENVSTDGSIYAYSNDGSVTVNATNCEIAAGKGIYATSHSDNTSASVQGCTIEATGDFGVEVASASGIASLSMENSNISGANYAGVVVDGHETGTMTVKDSVVSGKSHGISFGEANVVTGEFSRCTVTGGQRGLHSPSQTGSLLNVTDSAISGGITVEIQSGDATLNVTGSKVSSSDDMGIYMFDLAGSSLTANITDSEVAGEWHGIRTNSKSGTSAVNLAGETQISSELGDAVHEVKKLTVRDGALYASKDDSGLLGVFKGLSGNLIDLAYGLPYLRTGALVTGAASLPGTGDPSMLGAWVCLLSAAGAGMAIRRKK